MGAVRILIVDDDRALRDALRRALVLAGYETVPVENGEGALAEIARGQPAPQLSLHEDGHGHQGGHAQRPGGSGRVGVGQRGEPKWSPRPHHPGAGRVPVGSAPETHRDGAAAGSDDGAVGAVEPEKVGGQFAENIGGFPRNGVEHLGEGSPAGHQFGHFQLTARLWPALLRANGARVVALSSHGHHRAGVDFDDPNFERRPYDRWIAYGTQTSNTFSVEAIDSAGNRSPTSAITLDNQTC